MFEPRGIVDDGHIQLAHTPRTLEVLYRALKVVQTGGFPLLVGPRASGKGAIARLLIALLHMPYFRQNLTDDTDVQELIGGYTAGGWSDGPLLQAIRATGAPGGLLLDEVNLASSALLERLNEFFDGRTAISITEREGAERVNVHPNAVVIGAMNPPTSGYEGRKRLSPALMNRFTIIPVAEPDDAETRTIAVFRGGQRGVPAPLCEALHDLHTWAVKTRSKNHRGPLAELSLRTLDDAVDMVAKTWRKQGACEAFNRIGRMIYLPCLGTEHANALEQTLKRLEQGS